VNASLYDPDAARRVGVDTPKVVDAAVTLGSPSIRVHIQGVRSRRGAYCREPLRDRRHGAEKNIVINSKTTTRIGGRLLLVKVLTP
jgi:hypothetical protein